MGGVVSQRVEGTPQGGSLSPLPSNILLDDLDKELERRGHAFCRYADDAICHCQSEEQARALLEELEKRFTDCGLVLHPEKTKIVFCKDDDRRGNHPDHKFDFLGYTFRPRLAKRRGGRIGVSFSPAVSNKA